jgi:O-acetyl-ADP-ribose deacetylase (regulator of RNase III)
MRLGEAVATGPGKLPFKKIIHVAGINMLWRASKVSIRDSTINAARLATSMQLKSLAYPLIGAGSGGFSATRAREIMRNVLAQMPGDLEVILVEFKPALK